MSDLHATAAGLIVDVHDGRLLSAIRQLRDTRSVPTSATGPADTKATTPDPNVRPPPWTTAMPEPTNAALELAATGTPGPWVVTPTQYGPTVDDRDGGMIFVESYGITWTPNHADAFKITRLVNALGPLGDAFEDMARTHYQITLAARSSRHLLAEHVEGSPACDDG